MKEVPAARVHNMVTCCVIPDLRKPSLPALLLLLSILFFFVIEYEYTHTDSHVHSYYYHQ